MDQFKFNKWQRLVLVFGALAFLSRAFVLWNDDDKPGTAFLVGLVLTVAALTRPREGDEILPFWNRLTRSAGTHRSLLAISLGGLAIVVVGVTLGLSLKTSDYASEEAAADTVEMPAEEAMPADAVFDAADVEARAKAFEAQAAARQAAEKAEAAGEIEANALAADQAAREAATPPPYAASRSIDQGNWPGQDAESFDEVEAPENDPL